MIIAIIIGFAIGLALTFFAYKTIANQSGGKIISPLAEGKIISTPTPSISQTLTLISPIDQSIAKEGKTTVSGFSSPFSWIVILGEKGEKTIKADGKGNFETDLLLISGENEIKVTSFSDQNEEVGKVVTIVYSTAEI